MSDTTPSPNAVTERPFDNVHHNALAETGYWGKCGAGCIIMSKDSGRILFPLRGPEVLQPGTWGTWGGAVDPGEDPMTAALREACEESGEAVPEEDARLLYVYEDKKVDFSYHNFLVMVPTEFEPNLCTETEDALWLPLEDAPSPRHFGLQAILDNPEAMAILQQTAEECGLSQSNRP